MALSPLPMELYGLVAPCFFVVLVLVTWRHNHSTFPRENAEWDRSFMCQCCGSVLSPLQRQSTREPLGQGSQAPLGPRPSPPTGDC
jgi:hypothetical protein